MGQKKHDDKSDNFLPNTRGIERHEEATKKNHAGSSPSQAAYNRVLRHVANGNYQKALELLRSAGREPRMQNVVGVCLLRMGRAEEAVRIFRDLVLAPGIMGLKPETPLTHKINYATSLLLAGHPAGCLDTLAELGENGHPSVQRLRAVIKDWERSLSFWQWLNWRCGRIEPNDAPVTLESPPGEFEDELTGLTNHEPDTPESDE
jgi:tetratricopeptide (TPR) repeat protein